MLVAALDLFITMLTWLLEINSVRPAVGNTTEDGVRFTPLEGILFKYCKRKERESNIV